MTNTITRNPYLLIGLLTLLALSGTPVYADESQPRSKDPDVLGNMIGDMNSESEKSNRQAADFNRAHQDMMNASAASADTVERARLQVDRANREAQTEKSDAATRASRADREESWSSTISDGVTDGFQSGAALIGGAVAGGINAAAREKNDD
jgi:hypothetical protein